MITKLWGIVLVCFAFQRLQLIEMLGSSSSDFGARWGKGEWPEQSFY